MKEDTFVQPNSTNFNNILLNNDEVQLNFAFNLILEESF